MVLVLSERKWKKKQQQLWFICISRHFDRYFCKIITSKWFNGNIDHNYLKYSFNVGILYWTAIYRQFKSTTTQIKSFSTLAHLNDDNKSICHRNSCSRILTILNIKTTSVKPNWNSTWISRIRMANALKNSF